MTLTWPLWERCGRAAARAIRTWWLLRWEPALAAASSPTAEFFPGPREPQGEIGHIHVMDGEQEMCNCGNYGCLEQYTSATGIVRLAKRRLEEDDKPSALRNNPNISAKAVFDAVKEGRAGN